MDRRSEPRFEFQALAMVTILSEPPVTFPAEISNVSGRGMRLLASRSIPLDVAIRVDWDDSMYLGDVVYCSRQQDRFAIGLELDQKVSEVSSLGRLIENLLNPPPDDRWEAAAAPAETGQQ